MQALLTSRDKMGDKPFIKFYPSDFLAGTSGLSPAERGVYITLLCLIYEKDGPISNETARLSRRCGVPAGTFKRILSALVDVGKISEVDGMLTNRRAERSITDRSDRVNSAKVAAQSRWSKETEKTEQNQSEIDAPAMRSDMRSQCASDAIPEPEPDIPVGASKSPRDLASVIFSDGLALLTLGGVSEKQARGLLGKWRKQHGDGALIDALGKCQREGAVDPVAYIEGCFRYSAKRSEPQIGDTRVTPNGKRQEYMGGGMGWANVV